MMLLKQFPNKTLNICKQCFMQIAKRHFSNKNPEWNAGNVRNSFLEFFCNKHGHLYVPSSSVIPMKGQGTYFTNAGMNQFKQIFLGKVDPMDKLSEYSKVTNYQKCIRVGGKHNDLEDVGRDLYHHTFFEMLGSWSFGDYFKREACSMALELLTSVYKLPLSRLYFSYFSGDSQLGLLPDLETRDIWLSLGVPEERVLACGMKDNFWDMGFTGPCGPCTEIHYDHTGEGTGAHLVNKDSPFVVEIWNLVFMQYNRSSDGSLESLPTKHVDTGMGLERLLAVLQGSVSNYDTDLFQPIFTAISKEARAPAYGGKVGEEDVNGVDMAYRVVADHLRMSSICIADGLFPGRTDLPYQLRNVMLRCIHQAYNRLGLEVGSLSRLVDVVIDNLGDAHPALQNKHQKIKEITKTTELWYDDIMKNSKKLFDKYLMKRTSTESQIPVEDLLMLNNNIPFEILGNLANEHGLTVDSEEFYHHLQLEQKEKDCTEEDKTELTLDMIKTLEQNKQPYTDDVFKYFYTSSQGQYDFGAGLSASVQLLVSDGFIEKVKKGDKCGILLNKTNFYSEAGGQTADIGDIKTTLGIFRVTDVQNYGGYVLHCGIVEEGEICVGNEATLHIDKDNRLGCMRSHTATHLLNSSLRRVVSPELEQSGSSVSKEKLTFEFLTFSKVDDEAIEKVEDLVLEAISKKMPVHRKTMKFQDVTHTSDVVHLRNYEYPAEVTVVSCGEDKIENKHLVSAEVCCGTHVDNTADIGDFCVISVTGTGQAKKMFKCFTGEEATQAIQNGKRLYEDFLQLTTELQEKGYREELSALEKQIQGMMTNKDLPRRIRQRIHQALNKSELHRLLKEGEGMVAKKRLTQKAKAAINTDEKFVMFQCHMKNFRMADKVLWKLDVSEKPLVVVSEDDSFTGVIFMAHEDKISDIRIIAEKLMADLQTEFPSCPKWKMKQTKKKEITCFYLTIATGKKEFESYCYKQILDMMLEHYKGDSKEKKLV